MKETSYTSFDEFKDFCLKWRNKPEHANGICKACRVKRICKQDWKKLQIDCILHLQRNSTRFPLFYDLVMWKPIILGFVPSSVYMKVYGGYNSQLPCPFNGEEIVNHLDEIKKTLLLLSDEESRQTLINVLMYRLTFDREYAMRAYSQTPQYFIEPFRGLRSDEVFVDCGSFTGDTLEEYCRYNAVPRKAYLFEPDSENVKKLLVNIEKYKRKAEIEIIQKGVYRYTGELWFNAGKGAGSNFTMSEQTKGQPISVVSLDDAIEEPFSFLKMDIEGSEIDAIIGAKAHIANNYPKLAISIYHSVSDLWNIPLLIQKLFPKYTEYVIKHHTTFFGDTVLYVYNKEK